MSIHDARAGHIQPAPFRSAMPRREFLKKTLSAVKSRRGLIHGSMVDHGRVCALGAFAKKHDNCCVDLRLAEEIQEFNDSMPKASPKTRRAKMIRWLEEKLAALS